MLNEEGCLALSAVAERDNPGFVGGSKIYRDRKAREAHLGMPPHFQKFRTTEAVMVRASRLPGAVPVSLASKQGVAP